jgi:hypothetical protein
MENQALTVPSLLAETASEQLLSANGHENALTEPTLPRSLSGKPSRRDAKFQSALKQPAIRTKLNDLRVVVEAYGKTTHQWDIGDKLNELEGIGFKISDAIRYLHDFGLRELGLNDRYLYDYAKVSRAIPNPEDRQGLNWFTCFAATQAWKRIGPDARTETPAQIARRMFREGLSGRMIRRNAGNQARQRLNEKARIVAREAIGSNYENVADHCFNMDCREVIAGRVGDESLDLIHLDPPYSTYTKESDGELSLSDTYGSDLRFNCRNLTKAQSEQLVVDMLDLARSKLTPKGCILLWQAGGKPDNWKILKAIEDFGYVCPFAGLWDKKIPQANDLTHPFSIASERFLIIYKKGSRFIDHSPVLAGRRDIVDPDRLSEYFARQGMERVEGRVETRDFQHKRVRGDAATGACHVMQKHDLINQFFLRKLTYEGDTVFDACGCSGSMSIAAIESNRRWIHCEAYGSPSSEFAEETDGLYEWGVSRIIAALERKRTSADTSPTP